MATNTVRAHLCNKITLGEAIRSFWKACLSIHETFHGNTLNWIHLSRQGGMCWKSTRCPTCRCLQEHIVVGNVLLGSMFSSTE